MVYFELIHNTGSEYALCLVSDDEGNDLDTWVFDTEGGLRFAGHMSDIDFAVLRDEGLLDKRESVFAAARYGPKDADYQPPSSLGE